MLDQQHIDLVIALANSVRDALRKSPTFNHSAAYTERCVENYVECMIGLGAYLVDGAIYFPRSITRMPTPASAR